MTVTASKIFIVTVWCSLFLMVQLCTAIECGPPAVLSIDPFYGSPHPVSIGSTLQMTATAYDACDQPLEGLTVQWVSLTPSVGTITSEGLFTAYSQGTTSVGASLQEYPDIRTDIVVTVTRSDLVINTLSSRLSPQDLSTYVIGPEIVIQNIEFQGSPVSAGTFSGGDTSVGFENGIILSSGCIPNIIGPNQSDWETCNLALSGDSDLDTQIPGYSTLDATVLEFDFIPQSSVLSFQYVFGSEEYNEFVNSEYNDVFGFYVNGKNFALVPGTSTPVSVNTINGGNPYGDSSSSSYPESYINNDMDDGTALIPTEMDGFTIPLTATAPVKAHEINHIKLAIADAVDQEYDSFVLIKADSLVAPATADLNLTKQADPGSYYIGSPVIWNLTLTNDGPDTATEINVLEYTANLVGYSVLSNTTSKGFFSGDTWVLSELKNGETATLSLVMEFNSSGLKGNKASVTSDAPDPSPGNNVDQASVIILDTSNLPPIAFFTFAPENPCVNDLVTFNASAAADPDGSIVSYTWTFDDGDKGSEIVTSHRFVSPGTHIVNLTVTDDDGAANTTANTVKVLSLAGDLNSDGSVTWADVVMCAYMSWDLIPPDVEAADFNESGMVEWGDVVNLAYYYWGLTPEL